MAKKKPPVENLSREELLALVRELERKNAELRKENEQLKRAQHRQALHFPKGVPSTIPRRLDARRVKDHFGDATRQRKIPL